MPTITGVHHLSLTVRDADASEEFYCTTLGFVRVFELPDAEGRGLKRILAHPETRTVVGFTVHAGNDGSAFSPYRTGLDHLAFGVSSRAELEAWCARLDELNVAHSDIRNIGIGDLMTFEDPDGVQIELWADPAR